MLIAVKIEPGLKISYIHMCFVLEDNVSILKELTDFIGVKTR